MNDKNTGVCTVCLKIYNVKFDLMKEITPEIMKVLLLKPNLDITEENMICKECGRKLQNVVDFKSYCISTENKICIKKSNENVKLDFEKTPREENYIVELTNESEDQKLCRFCKKLTEKGSYVYLQEMKENIFILDTLRKYIPELHVNITDELITCETCLFSLQSLSNFITDCADAEDKMKVELGEINNDSKLELKNIKELTAIHKPSHSEGNVAEMEANEIFINVKNEIDHDSFVEMDNVGSIKDEAEVKLEREDCERYGDIKIPEASLQRLIMPHQVIAETETYDRNRCTFQTKHKTNLVNHISTHNSPPEKTHACDKCTFEAKFKSSLTRHMLTHQDPSEVDPSELTLYKCEICSFNTKYRHSLKQHMLSHRSLSEINIYQCQRCPFKSKYQYSLLRHTLTHENSTAIKMYKCEKCSLKTKLKSSLIRHMLIHQNLSELKLYNCKICSFETIHKGSLKQHMLSHQSHSETNECKSFPQPSEMKTHTWDRCLYETKHVSVLQSHAHQGPSELKLYKCNKCSFESKYKCGINQHMLSHQSLSEANIHECDSCSFKTKYQRSLVRHMLTHQSPKEIKMYRCEKCSLETKLKSSLIRHMLTHQSPAELNWYQCKGCSFKTKHKGSFKQHMVSHHSLSVDK